MLKNEYIVRLLLFCFINIITCSCSNNPGQWQELQPINEYKLDLPEPSGLSFGKDYKTLWTVSDAPDNGIYNISLTGEVLQKLSFSGDDLEGIAYDSVANVLWVIEEHKRRVLQISLDGHVINYFDVQIDGQSGFGLEGIVLVSKNTFWLTHEKKPGGLFAFNHDFHLIDQKSFEKIKDYSGITYNFLSNQIWVVSDESKLLLNWNLVDDQVTRYNIPVKKAEGVAINPFENKLYIVSDKTSELLVFNLSQE